MPEERIQELEAQLLAANQSVARLTQSNAELTRGLAEAETHAKKLRRNSRRDEDSLRQQIATSQRGGRP